MNSYRHTDRNGHTVLLSYRPKGEYLRPNHKVLRGALVLDSDLVEKGYGQGRVPRPWALFVFRYIFCERGPAVGASAPLLGVSLKKYTGLPWVSLVSPSSLIKTHHSAGRTVGRHKSVHESSAGLSPKPGELFRERSFRKLNDGLGPVGHFLSFTPYS